ncbi:MAG TPA: FG-GAP-like repeat-containing protein [Thermoanaerobaculia bacterium]
MTFGRLVTAGLLCGAAALGSLALHPSFPAKKKGTDNRELLRKEFEGICQQFRTSHNSFYGLAQIDDLKRAIGAASANPLERGSAEEKLAMEMLRVGEPAESIRLLSDARAIAAAQPFPASLRQRLTRELGLAYLRQGEQTNCVGYHGPASCLLPIQGAGVHRDKTGALAAMEAFRTYLAEAPDDVMGRWLLNLAAMTAGQYPEGVPAAFRIDPKMFTSSYDIKKFTDVAMKAGIDITDSSGGAIVDDFDGDGLLDIVTSTINPCGPMHFFHNLGNGRFEDRTSRAGLDVQWGGLNVIHADYDNDGFPDLLVLRGGWFGSDGRVRMSLLHNNGDGTFTDVTEAAGLARPAYPTQTAAWADYDNDGYLDLYVGSEADDNGIAYPSRLYHNNRDGTFTNVAEKAGVENFLMAKAVAWGDYDGDGYPDLYVSNIGPNRLYHNNRDGTFTDVAAEAGVIGPGVRNFPAWFFDYDNDGRLDIFNGTYSASVADVVGVYFGRPPTDAHPRLYHNEGNGKFRDVSAEVGLTAPSLPMGSNFGDLDNDGWLDVYLGTGLPSFESLMPNLMYRNVEGKKFVDVSFSGGFAHLQKGHGVAFADINNDGDQDVFEQMGGAYPGDAYMSVLYENPGHGNSWVTLKLVGTKTNRNAIGARIKVTVRGPSGTRSIYRAVGSVASFGGSPFRQEIGLGPSAEIEEIDVFWPTSRTTQKFRGVAVDHFYEIHEGEDKIRSVSLPKFHLGGE